jgi:flavin-dependent dehydrogenase
MTHPATAEGIYQGMRSGMLAAEALHGILNGGMSPASVFAHYESACRKVFGTSFRGALLWRSLVSAGGLDLLVGAMNRPVTQRMLARSMARM